MIERRVESRLIQAEQRAAGFTPAEPVGASPTARSWLHKSKIEVFGGETSSQKKFLIRDCTLEELRERIQQALS